jgi:hypothetical protein
MGHNTGGLDPLEPTGQEFFFFLKKLLFYLKYGYFRNFTPLRYDLIETS